MATASPFGTGAARIAAAGNFQELDSLIDDGNRPLYPFRFRISSDVDRKHDEARLFCPREVSSADGRSADTLSSKDTVDLLLDVYDDGVLKSDPRRIMNGFMRIFDAFLADPTTVMMAFMQIRSEAAGFLTFMGLLFF